MIVDYLADTGNTFVLLAAFYGTYILLDYILILDEPTSALDPIAENDIMKRLYQLGMDKTVTCISHRLSSAIYSNKIAVFDHGGIAEYGSHEDLMNRKGL